ncbi:SDR family NAD(P)-dependent oxidoreductase [Frigidibacter sp. MR17.24]|uniref:SDR family NAD(P)-dependent oxidoreductase n=1 Tax=Frigidibacter sp. MR17.24 TaxID=3127345 RepID=UPI003012C5FC
MIGTACILVTGAAAGIGRAVALAAAARGADVWLWDRDAEALARTAADIGPQAHAAVVDVADADAIRAAEARLAERPPTHLVNNAGILGRPMALSEMDADEIDRALAINLRGTLLVTSAFLRARVPHPQAAIVNMASIAGVNGGAPGHAVYGATKGAMLALTAAMARDLAPELRVNAIAPGIIDTDIQKTVFADRAALAATASGIPLARVGQPEEVAEAADWLLFGAGYVTGEIIRVGGGRK